MSFKEEFKKMRSFHLTPQYRTMIDSIGLGLTIKHRGTYFEHSLSRDKISVELIRSSKVRDAAKLLRERHLPNYAHLLKLFPSEIVHRIGMFYLPVTDIEAYINLSFLESRKYYGCDFSTGDEAMRNYLNNLFSIDRRVSFKLVEIGIRLQFGEQTPINASAQDIETCIECEFLSKRINLACPKKSAVRMSIDKIIDEWNMPRDQKKEFRSSVEWHSGDLTPLLKEISGNREIIVMTNITTLPHYNMSKKITETCGKKWRIARANDVYIIFTNDEVEAEVVDRINGGITATHLWLSEYLLRFGYTRHPHSRSIQTKFFAKDGTIFKCPIACYEYIVSTE